MQIARKKAPCLNVHPAYGRCDRGEGHPESKHGRNSWPEHRAIQFRSIVTWYESEGINTPVGGGRK